MSESGAINQYWTTYLQPNKTIPFRLPRMRAIANMIYPATPLSVTEWSANFAGETDFSTALADADAYGILGRERAYLASRWVAPVPGNPNYLALKLYRNYDGAHDAFQPTSISAVNNGDPDLFSSYASLNSTGNTLTAMVLNKDPSNIAQVQFAFNGFTPSQVTSYTLSSTDPTQIVASGPKSWTSTINFAPYSATLLVITGSAQVPGAEWDLNPDTTMLAAGGRVVLSPTITSGTATVTLGTPQYDSGITVTVNQATLRPGQNGTITVTSGSTPGFYHYSVPSTDSAGVAQQQEWMDPGGQSVCDVDQDGGRPARPQGNPAESFGHTQRWTVRGKRGGRNDLLFDQRGNALAAYCGHRFERQGAGGADSAFDAGHNTRHGGGAIRAGASTGYVYGVLTIADHPARSG